MQHMQEALHRPSTCPHPGITLQHNYGPKPPSIYIFFTICTMSSSCSV